jgi:hypothetical protein
VSTNAPEAPSDHAMAAAGAIRSLNHATLWPDDPHGYEWPSDVDDVVAALQLLVDRLPQALDQASRWLVGAQSRGMVGHDADADPKESVEAASRLFAASQQELTRLADDLRRLRDITSHLTGLGTGRGGD